MITLVKHHETAAGMSPSMKEDFTDENKAIGKFFQYLANYAADETVIRADIVLMNDNLIPYKTEHYRRVMPVQEVVETGIPE